MSQLPLYFPYHRTTLRIHVCQMSERLNTPDDQICQSSTAPHSSGEELCSMEFYPCQDFF